MACLLQLQQRLLQDSRRRTQTGLQVVRTGCMRVECQALSALAPCDLRTKGRGKDLSRLLYQYR